MEDQERPVWEIIALNGGTSGQLRQWCASSSLLLVYISAIIYVCGKWYVPQATGKLLNISDLVETKNSRKCVQYVMERPWPRLYVSKHTFNII